jgi:hypothetical protein
MAALVWPVRGPSPGTLTTKRTTTSAVSILATCDGKEGLGALKIESPASSSTALFG